MRSDDEDLSTSFSSIRHDQAIRAEASSQGALDRGADAVLSPSRHSPAVLLKRLAYACATSALLMIWIILSFGYPSDIWTWMVLAIGFLAALPTLATRFWLIGLAVACYYFLSILLAQDGDNMVDTRGGRGELILRFWKGQEPIRFGRSGPNTALLERYLGPLDPDWVFTSARKFRYGGAYRCYSDRVNTRNIIFAESLAEILAMLPSDDARAQVLECVTDRSNLLRIHQGLLLTCLHEWGFPPGLDVDSWWARHEWSFQRETDGEKASRAVWGWRKRIEEIHESRGSEDDCVLTQLAAADYHERGSVDSKMGGAMEELESGEKIDETDPTLAVNRVAWWPTHPEANRK